MPVFVGSWSSFMKETGMWVFHKRTTTEIGNAGMVEWSSGINTTTR